MIAAHTSQATVQHTPKTRKSPKFDQIAPLSGQSMRSTEQVLEAQNIGTAQPATRRRLYIARSIKRMIDSDLFGHTHVESYLNRLARCGCRDSTIKMNFSALYLFINYLKSQDRSCLETAVRADISGFIEHEQDRGLAPTTISTRMRCLYAFLKYLSGREVVHPDLLKKKFRIKLPDTLPRAIDPEDIRKLLSVINHVRNRAMVLMLLRTGMRIGELLGLKIVDVNIKEKRVEIIEAQKTRTGRVVYLSDDACSAVKAWFNVRCSEKLQLFYAQGRSTISYEASRTMFKNYLDKAGLVHKDYSLHCLRHTFASELLNAGMRLECVQQLLGHRNIEQTRRYARLTDNTRKEEYFRAMAIIEKGGINGHYRIDSALPQAFEA
jgi:site-specific recombinase XerD